MINTRMRLWLPLLASFALVEVAVAQTALSTSVLTPAEIERIEHHVLAERRPSVTAPASVQLVAGGILPGDIELFWMSPAVGLNHLRYAIVDGRTVVAVPYTRQIIAVLR